MSKTTVARMSWALQRNTLRSVGLWGAGSFGLVVLAITLVLVLRLLQGAKEADQLAAAAALLGGLIGAGGSAFAVYLTIAGQRRDEAEKIEASIRAEVSEFARLALGLHEVCEQVLKGYEIPLRDLPGIMYMPQAAVFGSTADRISRLSYGPLVVILHARIAEALQMVRVYAAAGTPPAALLPGRIGEMQALSATMATLKGDKATTLATAWLDVCEVARTILMRDVRGFEIAEAATLQTLRDLDALHGRAQRT
jgi:hypothetical protein